MIKHYAIVKGDSNGKFCCLAEFGFNPPICVRAAPKISNLFLNKGLEKCKAIAEKLGFEFTVMDAY